MTALTVADLVRPISRPRAIAWNATLVLGGSLFLALCAQIRVPLGLVPFTMQTFGVVTLGALLGSRRATAAVIAYLAEGAAGLPVFAGGVGPATFVGPTAGYMAGFIAAACLVGMLAERGWDRRFATTALAMLAGHAVILMTGVAWLTVLLGFQKALAAGLLPFLPGCAFKTMLAAAILPAAWKIIGIRRGREA